MARDVSDAVRDALGNAVREALKNVGDAAPTKNKSGPLSGAKGIAAGMGLAAAAPLAKRGVDAMRGNGKPIGAAGLAGKVATKASDRVGDKLKDTVGSKVDEAGGAGGLVREAASGMIPGLGGDGGGGGKGGVPGVGKGRRMPVQQSVDVAVPIETAYNQWTQFEDWPQFMHRVTRVTQVDDCTVSFATKIWGKTKEFEAKIDTQRPEERIKWRVAQGMTHTGVVTFHELAPRLTRIELNIDVDPGSLIEKVARGMRHVKRAVRADLHRFKAFIEMQELETGAWRGVIEDGELVEPHDDSYDEERDYSEIEDAFDEEPESEEDEDTEQDEGGNGSGRARTQRFKRQAEQARSGGRAAASSRSSSSRSSGGSSGRSRGGSSSGGSSSGGSRRSSGSSGSSSSGRSRGSSASGSTKKRSTAGKKSTSRS